jgi:hypothetical protein
MKKWQYKILYLEKETHIYGRNEITGRYCMPGYRRFVAYVYEYRKGKKEENCGYIRVEAREQECRMEVHIRCPGLPADALCRLYGLVRTPEGTKGICIHSFETVQDGMECAISGQRDSLDEAGTRLEQIGGLVLLTDGGAFFGTEWDDIPIRQEEFQRSLTQEETENGEKGNNEKEHREPNKKLAEEQTASVTPEKKEELTEEAAKGVSKEKMEEATKEVADERTESVTSQKTEPEITAQEAQLDMPEERRRPAPVLLPGNPPAFSEAPPAPSQAPSAPTPQPALPGVPFEPFTDGVISDCRRLQLKDLRCLLPCDSGLRNNRFLTHGYYSFGHLLLGKTMDGQYILGVPGGYDQQERFMAGMFGFPYFKESRQIELPGGRGGYWYRLINAPNCNARNGG